MKIALKSRFLYISPLDRAQSSMSQRANCPIVNVSIDVLASVNIPPLLFNFSRGHLQHSTVGEPIGIP